MSGTIIRVAIAALLLAAIAAAETGPAGAIEVSGEQLWISARRLDDGRVEVRAESAWRGDQVQPERRYLPANAPVGRWLRSDRILVGWGVTGRIEARRLSDGRTELSFSTWDDYRLLPEERYLPPDAPIGRWLRSSELGFTRDRSIAIATGRFVAVDTSFRHTCGVRETGEVQCWGWDYWGEVDAAEGRFTDVSVSSQHSCGVRETGEVVCWGWSELSAWEVPEGRFTAVGVDWEHTCGLRTTGEIACWGSPYDDRTNVPAGRFTAVSVGDRNTCGLRETQEILCWGAEETGVNEVPGGQFNAVTVGFRHACGLRETGEATCWGEDGSNYLGMPDTRFTALAAGVGFTCGLLLDGAVRCWGGHRWDSESPTARFRAVSAGGNHACGLQETGAIVCWGEVPIGRGSETDSRSPIECFGVNIAPVCWWDEGEN